MALVAVAGLVLVRSNGSGDGSARPLVEPGDPGVAHVHGLGIDPADGALMVATHSGLFRLDSEGREATRVGSSYQDTMGFTVAGPNHYLGSGHPDLQGFEDGQPGLIGLIESTDGGASWRALSLAGQADFHGLAAADDITYGWNATTGAVMATADRRSWDTLATVDLLGFVVDPSSSTHLLGASPDGLTESLDGGRTWAEAAGPDLVAVSWDADEGLWGIDDTGQVWRAQADDWREAGRMPGEPHAFLAAPEGYYAATADRDGITTIFRSEDGERWEPVFRDAG